MNNTGFTLLEVIIYCALFSVLMTSSIVTVYALMSSSEKTTRDTNIVAEITFVNQKLDWLLYSATDVNKINSTTLQIIRPDLGSSSPIIFSEMNNIFYITHGTGIPEQLIGNQFYISATTVIVDGLYVQVDYVINELPQRYVTYLQK